jgi:hypothetical protein
VNELPVPAILATILGAVMVAWLLRRARPAMPPLRRLMYIVGGGILVGGFLYGMILTR